MGRLIGSWVLWIGIALAPAPTAVAQSGTGSAAADSAAAGETEPGETDPSRQPLPDSLRVNEGVPLGQFGSHLNAYPYAYYTPETEFAIGAGGIFTFYTAKDEGLRPSKIALSGYISTKDQYKITLSPDLFFNQNHIFTELDLDYGRYVDRFYGIGEGTADIDSSEYVIRGWGLRTEIQLPPPLRFFSRTRTGFSYEIKQREITDTRGNPNLEAGQPRGLEGGLESALGWVWAWDTRDHVFYPKKGVYSRLSGAYYMGAIGSDYDYNRYKADIRNYHAVGEKGVLALQFLVHWTPGHPPFYELPALGGAQMLRGYYEGRYRDVLYLAGQIEYRRTLTGRLGMVAFAALGDVGTRITGIQIRTSQFSGGAGLRYLFNQSEKVNLRVDLGIGKNTNGVYFGLEEAF